MNTRNLVILAAVLAVIAGIIFVVMQRTQVPVAAISTYDQCVAAGYPVAETYPTQCMTPDGRTFVNQAQHLTTLPGGTATPSAAPSPAQTTATGGCVVGGCSGQICSDAKDGPAVSTCEYKAEYGCYKTATCARQSNGQCGWTATAALSACISNARSNGNSAPQVY